MRPRRLELLKALCDPDALGRLLGPVRAVRPAPLEGIGYSNAEFSRVAVEFVDGTRRTFVLKMTRLSQDWTARRTSDTQGREALVLDEPALAPVWDIFDTPVIAYATGAGEVGLLMIDLSPSVLPDVRAPLSSQEETALLQSLARLHSRFWGARAPAFAWLVRPGQYCDILGPSMTADPLAINVLPLPMREGVSRGWALALSQLPEHAARHLTCPGVEWERRWAHLPRTFLHGDAKVANFAILPNTRVAAFDWALAGAGPCGIDIGWYLAVNASRLTAPKEEVIVHYRRLLEEAHGGPVGNAVWDRLEEVAVITGARMLLWSKALALESGRPGARDEWDWWASRLVAIHRQPGDDG